MVMKRITGGRFVEEKFEGEYFLILILYRKIICLVMIGEFVRFLIFDFCCVVFVGWSYELRCLSIDFVGYSFCFVCLTVGLVMGICF